MNKNNQHYLWAGLFVIITASLMLFIWLWFISASRINYNTFLTIFHEPVDGLSINSLVKYSGVQVGRVKLINLNELNPREIRVYLDILPTIAINKQTTASLKQLGVTGLSYIELRLDKNAVLNNNLSIHNSVPYPIIQTSPSFLYNLSEQSQLISNNIQDVSKQMKLMLSDNNLNNFAHIINNLNTISGNISKVSGNVSNNILHITNHIVKNTATIESMLINFTTLTKTLNQTANSTNTMVEQINNNTLNNINTIILPNLNNTITNMNSLTEQANELITEIKQNPGVLIHGSKPKPYGPGEQ